jgi:hypothetical protein
MVPNCCSLGPIRRGTATGWTKMEQQYGGALYTDTNWDGSALETTHVLSLCYGPAAHKPGERYVPVPCQPSDMVQSDVCCASISSPFLRADQQIIAAPRCPLSWTKPQRLATSETLGGA